MKTKQLLQTILVAMLIVAIPFVAALEAPETIARNKEATPITAKAVQPSFEVKKTVGTVNQIDIQKKDGLAYTIKGSGFETSDLTKQKLRDLIPPTLEEAQGKVDDSLETYRYLFWTKDGENVLAGKLANGFFVGKVVVGDQKGELTWGIYSDRFIAGFIGNEFFYGKYSAKAWAAIGIFGNEGISKGYFWTSRGDSK